MIRENIYNSRWWGAPVATVDDPAFFSLAPEARSAALKRYAWAEFKAPFATAPPVAALVECGFMLVDVQLSFRLMMQAVPDSPSLTGLDCQFADHSPFKISPDETRAFEHERFLQLPGVSPERLTDRYVNWSNQMVREQPQWCACVSYKGQPQGWFLSTMTERGLYLALAMLSKTAQISGPHLYQAVIRAYGGRGARIGYASFSARNVAVLNIYSQLGARFTSSEGIWLWYAQAQGQSGRNPN